MNGVPCQFRTAYETTLWPLKVTSASWKTPDRLNLAVRPPNVAGALSLRLDCFQDVSFAKLDLSTLSALPPGRRHPGSHAPGVAVNSCVQIVIRDPAPGSRKQVVLNKDSVRQVGFAAAEDVLPTPAGRLSDTASSKSISVFPKSFASLT